MNRPPAPPATVDGGAELAFVADGKGGAKPGEGGDGDKAIGQQGQTTGHQAASLSVLCVMRVIRPSSI